jgi:hypothetical protein
LTAVAGAKTRERGNDLLVGDLSEVLVKPSDRAEPLVSFEADNMPNLVHIAHPGTIEQDG